MLTFFDHFGTKSDHFGPISDHIGPYWTILDHVDLRSSVVTNISSYDPYTHTYLTFVSGYQVSMCICRRPDIYGCLSTRYLWVSVIFFLPEGKAVGQFVIAIPVLLFFSKSLFTIHNLFLPLGKAVAIFLIAIPVLLIFSKSLFTIHGVLQSFSRE